MYLQRLFWMVGGVIVASLIGYAVVCQFPSSGGGSPVGDPAFVEFAQKDERSNQLTDYRLSQFKGKPLVINFWASWCGYCIQELPSLDALAEKMRAKGGDVLTILLDPVPGKGYLAFQGKDVKRLKLYHDHKGEIGKAFRAGEGGLPLTVFLDKNGKEVFRHRGAVDWNGTEAAQKVKEHLGLEL